MTASSYFFSHEFTFVSERIHHFSPNHPSCSLNCYNIIIQDKVPTVPFHCGEYPARVVYRIRSCSNNLSERNYNFIDKQPVPDKR